MVAGIDLKSNFYLFNISKTTDGNYCSNYFYSGMFLSGSARVVSIIKLMSGILPRWKCRVTANDACLVKQVELIIVIYRNIFRAS